MNLEDILGAMSDEDKEKVSKGTIDLLKCMPKPVLGDLVIKYIMRHLDMPSIEKVAMVGAITEKFKVDGVFNDEDIVSICDRIEKLIEVECEINLKTSKDLLGFIRGGKSFDEIKDKILESVNKFRKDC